MKYHLCPICYRIISYEDFPKHYQKCVKKEIEENEKAKKRDEEIQDKDVTEHD